MQTLPATGSEVVIRQQRWRVDRAFRHGSVVEIGAGAATFFVPFDRVAIVARRDRPRRVRPQRWRAVVAHASASAESFDLPLAARSASIELLPHQLEPWLAASSGIRRLLIADEVGLGKTIQAGLIVAEAQRRSAARRVLILAPATLCSQWRQELLDRFGITAAVVDAEALRELATALPRDVNPWSLDGVYLTSIDFIKQPHVMSALPDSLWDILVIDEAHTLCGDSTRHDAGHEIASRARQVLLLTATPHSGDETAARRLERLGVLEALGGGDSLTVFRRSRLDVGPGPLRRVRRLRVAIDVAERRTLDLVGRFGAVLRDRAPAEFGDAAELLLAVFRKRALSTFGALCLSIDRRLAFLDGERPDANAGQLSLFGDGDDAAISFRVGLPVERERRWLGRLRALAVVAARCESKVCRLRTLIGRTAEPVIVFTEFRDSLVVVERGLSGVATVSVAHGGLTSGMLADALNAFQSGRSRVLIATDVASQGLNLQHRCRWVIHFDRPWNPVRLEQRAGRVDRLGQVRDVHVTELMTSHDREIELAERVGRRAQAAATSEWLRPCGLWARRARAAARVLHARRRLAAQWRGPEVSAARPVAAKREIKSGVNSAGLVTELTPDFISLFRTDIRDRDGYLCESVLTWGEARARLAPRLRRLARLEAGRAARRSAVARALSARHRETLTQLALPGTHVFTNAPEHPGANAPVHPLRPELLTAEAPRLIAIGLD